MSSLRVNKITNYDDNGPVEFTRGVILPEDQQINNIVVDSVGVVTATSFSGSGMGITTFGVVNEISTGKAIAFTLIG